MLSHFEAFSDTRRVPITSIKNSIRHYATIKFVSGRVFEATKSLPQAEYFVRNLHLKRTLETNTILVA